MNDKKEQIQQVLGRINDLEVFLADTRAYSASELETRRGIEDVLLSLRRELASLRERDCVVPLELLPTKGNVYHCWDRWRAEVYLQSNSFLFVEVLLPNNFREVWVFRFSGVKVLTFGWPDLEVFEGHSLSDNGIDVFGLFEVECSSLLQRMRDTMDAYSSYGSSELENHHHFILKDEPGELVCIALGVDVWVSEHDYDEINATLAEAERESRNHQ